MFTGLVEAVGNIVDVEMRDKGCVIAIDVGDYEVADVALGDSILVNGVCLTVNKLVANTLWFDVSPETMGVTTGFDDGTEVNLEKAMRLSDRLGGHLVTGHIDTTGEIGSIDIDNNNYEVQIIYPGFLAPYISRKGSIAVNGVSLTVNATNHNSFSVNLIPHTWSNTALRNLGIKSKVNLEVDLVARYVERMLSISQGHGK